jgi:transcriptional repressor of cell division inhibition gene dicB
MQRKENKMKTSEAIEHFGSIKKLADALGIWPHPIYRWKDSPPKLRQFELERLTDGELVAD